MPLLTMSPEADFRDIMGVQPRSAKKSERLLVPSEFSPRQRAQKRRRLHEGASDDSQRWQRVVEYNEMMSGDVDFYLRKFEANIKAQK